MVQPQTSFWQVLTQRKAVIAEQASTDIKLNRVLGLYDLTALGVGSTLGAGIYVLAGQIAKEQAGPAVILSFAIAAIASLLAGLCYAELGARVPKAGSAYIYCYVCIGEFVAFVIGWNLILEYIMGTASVCRGISLYLDTLLNDTLKITFLQIAPMNKTYLAEYFDFFACSLVIFFGVTMTFGVETSALLNNLCTTINIFILLFVIIAGSFKADFSNWTIDPAMVNITNTDLGEGGFFPFGSQGVFKGAATCFFGFVGFDCIATTGEEVREPQKNIPRSILLSLLLIFLFYCGVSMVLTLMLPYYLQDSNAPLPYAFKAVGWNFAMWIICLGGLLGLLASLFGALFPLPLVIYAMAQDGLLFRALAKINTRFRTPVIASVFAALLTALVAGAFELAHLVHLLSIGTLLAYCCVAISVIILRFMDNREPPSAVTESTSLITHELKVSWRLIWLQVFNTKCLKQPNKISTRIVGVLIGLFSVISIAIAVLLIQNNAALQQRESWALVLLGSLLLGAIIILVLISLQPREPLNNIFRVPFVPLVPATSLFINIYLMLQLDAITWLRFAIWMIIGLSIYFFYGLPNRLRETARQRVGWQKINYNALA